MGLGQLAALPSCPTVGFPSSGIENAGITRMQAANNATNIFTLLIVLYLHLRQILVLN
jgi:hypothetical protein